MDGYTKNLFKDIELKIYPDPFFTSCQIYSMKKRLGLKSIKSKSTLQVGFNGHNTINSTKNLTSNTTCSNCFLIFGAYSKIPKLYGTDKISTDKVMDKLDVSQSRFGKIDKFGWWDLERISADAETQFISIELKEECQTRGFHLKLAAP